MFTRIPRGMVIDPKSSRVDRVIEVMRGLYPNLVDVEYQFGYVAGMDWRDFDVIFLGEYSSLFQEIREVKPQGMPSKMYIYSDAPSRNNLMRELRKLFPDADISAPGYSNLLTLLHDDGEEENFIGTY